MAKKIRQKFWDMRILTRAEKTFIGKLILGLTEAKFMRKIKRSNLEKVLTRACESSNKI